MSDKSKLSDFPRAERYIKRSPAKVGDLIQYRLNGALRTRRVIEVIDDGARFVVEGFYNVNAVQITTFIPMLGERDEAAELAQADYELDFCGNRNGAA